MSITKALDPDPSHGESADCIEFTLIPKQHDLGGFSVRRVLPSLQRQMIGPFIFFDHAGPSEFESGSGIDVRPHPHCGLATVTYLYEGEFRHRDSLGTDQMVYPGEVNWMIAGKAITHSERTSPKTRSEKHRLHGIQTWVALPDSAEEAEPAFEHCSMAELPFLEAEGKQARVILGAAYGERSPVSTHSPMFYVDVVLQSGAAVPLPDEYAERAVYIAQGAVIVAEQTFESGRMIVFRAGDRISIKSTADNSRLMLLGGAPFASRRFISWNFVTSSEQKMAAAKKAWREQDWVTGRFSLPPGDDEEFIPLPKDA